MKPTADNVPLAIPSSSVVQPVTVPAKRTPSEAAARLRELRRDTPLPKGMTIRDMIDEGRR